MLISWVVTLRRLVGSYQRFSPKDRNSMYFRNVDIWPRAYTASQSRRSTFSYLFLVFQKFIFADISKLLVHEFVLHFSRFWFHDALYNIVTYSGVLFTMELYYTPKSQPTTVKHNQQLFEHTYTSNLYGLGPLTLSFL
jgi:hypothetical protein